MVLKTKKINLSDETIFLLAGFQNMSVWEVTLFFLFLPMCFWLTTWCSDSWHPCANRLSAQSYWVQCISVLQRLGVPSPSFVFALHLTSYLRLFRSQVSLFRWASPHINTCITLTLRTVLTLQVPRKREGLEGLCTCVVASHTERNGSAQTTNANGGWL